MTNPETISGTPGRPDALGGDTRAVAESEVSGVPDRVAVTEAAAVLLRSLIAEFGALMFHQSGGCCDGSSPMCYQAGEFWTGDSDQYLGAINVGGPHIALEPELSMIPVWMSKPQFAYWRHTHLTIDVVQGRGAGFSLEAPTGHRFLIRSRLFSDEEALALEAAEASTA